MPVDPQLLFADPTSCYCAIDIQRLRLRYYVFIEAFLGFYRRRHAADKKVYRSITCEMFYSDTLAQWKIMSLIYIRMLFSDPDLLEETVVSFR